MKTRDTKISEERIFQKWTNDPYLYSSSKHLYILSMDKGHCCGTETNKAFDGYREME